jgi:dienelactone hydrolase
MIRTTRPEAVIWTIGASLVALVLTATIVSAQATDIDVLAADGAKLRATYSSPPRPGPGIVLFHQCDMDRHAWTSLAAALRERGIHTLATDYRGVGDNRALQADYAKRPADADAALAALAAMPGVDKTRLASGGASCGVDQAVQLARRTGQIKALVLLSGAATDAGMAYLRSANLPVLFAFSADEGGPLPNMKIALSASSNAATTIREFERAGHGVPMFASQPTLLPELADWLAKVLR